MSSRIIKFQPDGIIRKKGRSTLYYRSEQKDFLQEYCDGRAVAVTESVALRTLLLEKSAATLEDAHAVLYAVRRDCAISYDGPMPGYSRGLHQEGGKQFYCNSEPALLHSEPASEGPTEDFGSGWPVIHELLKRLLVNDEVGWDQFYTLCAALKNAVCSLRYALQPPQPGRSRSIRPGQAVALVGPRACGKTFLFEHVIAPLLGGRVVDAFKAFMSDSQGFNGELLGGEVWKIDDRECSTDIRTRRQFAANLKAFLYSSRNSFHRKYCTPVTLTPFGRLFILCNDTEENLRVLPEITPDIADKIHLLRCNETTPPMPTGTETEREHYRTAVRGELPFFLGDLERWEVPGPYFEDRSGVLSYHHTAVLRALRRMNPEAVFAELLQFAFAQGVLENPWRGRAIELQAALTDRSFASARLASDLLQYPSAVGRHLGRIIERAEIYAAEFGLDVTRSGQVRGVETYTVRRVEPASHPGTLL
jgi:hypothetical protein